MKGSRYNGGGNLIGGIAEFVRSRNTGAVGEYSMCDGGHVTLYSSCFAAMTLHYIGLLSGIEERDRQAWGEAINRWQAPDTGLYFGPEIVKEELASPIHDFEHVTMHLTAHVLPALTLLGSGPNRPLSFAHRYLDRTELLRWLEARDWSDAWLEGNNLLFIGQFLVFLRDREGIREAADALDLYFDWLDDQVDPDTGLWGTNGHCSLFAAMCGGYHQLIVYNYERRPIRHRERIVDSVLSLQHPDGGFHPWGGGGACEDADAADILVNLYKQVDYRRAEIRVALRRLLGALAGKRLPDGGFVYRRGEIFTHMGIKRTKAPADVSNLFATWFRVHTIALISEVLTDMPDGAFEWEFNKDCSMGWHRTWEKERYPVTAIDRGEEALHAGKTFIFRPLRMVANRMNRIREAIFPAGPGCPPRTGK